MRTQSVKATWVDWSSFGTGWCAASFGEFLDDGSGYAPLQYQHDNNLLQFRSLTNASDLVPAVPPSTFGIHLPPINAPNTYYSVIYGRVAGANLWQPPVAFLVTLRVNPNSRAGVCMAGFRTYRGSDSAGWTSFPYILEDGSDPANTDPVETVALQFHGGDPSDTFRAFSKGGMQPQVGHTPGSIAGTGEEGFFLGVPPSHLESDSTNIFWLPEGPRRGSMLQAGYDWTGGIALGSRSLSALVGGPTLASPRYVRRPFPDRQRAASHGGSWEWFFTAVTSSVFGEGETFGDATLGPMCIRRLQILQGQGSDRTCEVLSI